MSEPLSDTKSTNSLLFKTGQTLNATLIMARTERWRLQEDLTGSICVNNWILDVIIEGQQQQRIGNTPFFERKNDTLALYAPQTRFYERTRKNITIKQSFIVFSLVEPLSTAMKKLTGTAGYCHIVDTQRKLITPLKELGVICRSANGNKSILAYGLMLECLGHLLTSIEIGPCKRTLPTAENNPLLSLREQAHTYLERNVYNRISVDDFAKAMGVSRSALQHHYRKIANEPPYQAIIRSKIECAKRLLMLEGLNIQETAERLQFSSPFNFTRTFKRFEGCSPRAFIKEHKNESESARF